MNSLAISPELVLSLLQQGQNIKRDVAVKVEKKKRKRKKKKKKTKLKVNIILYYYYNNMIEKFQKN